MNVERIPRQPGTSHTCPDCGTGLNASASVCPRCGLSLVGPIAQRLWWIDAELASLDRRRRTLVDERPGVLARLRWESDPGRVEAASSATSAATPSLPGSHPARPLASPPPPAPDREMSRHSAQNVILGLGALLVGIAALVFAVWNWSDMGTGARATVLGLTTATFVLMALPLYRRGLHATAESFAVVATVLLCVDALALWILSPHLTNGPGYAAACLAVISALLALYPHLVPLRTPRILAAVLVQPVPLLLVAALPFDRHPAWLLTTLAVTGFAGTVVVHLIGAPRPLVPVRTLHGAAVTMWVGALVPTLVLLLSSGDPATHPPHWWALAATLLVCGATGLLMARRPGRTPEVPSGYSLAGLGSLALLPLAAGPANLPVLPRLTMVPWSLSPGDMTTPAVELLGLDGPALLPPLNLVHLVAIVVAATLALGTVAVLRHRALVVTSVLLAPTTLLAPPLLLGSPQAVAVVWALVLGAVLVLSSAVMPHRLNTLPVVVGFLTLVAGLVWALPERYTTLAALVVLTATALIAAAGALRFAERGRPLEPGGRAAVLYMGSTLTWGLALSVGTLHLFGNGGAGPEPAQWWILTGAVVLAGATALTLARVHTTTALRVPFAVVGVFLLPAAPLLALGAPVPSGDSVSGVLSAFGVLMAGVLVTLVVVLIQRRLAVVGVALIAPPTLLPLPLLLDVPFTVAIVWTVLVGAALLIGAALARGLGGAWAAWSMGLATLTLAFVWAVPDRYTTVGVLVAVAATASVAAALARTRSITVASTATATFGTGAFALALLIALWVPVEYAAFGPLVVVAAVAIGAPRLRSPLLEATEIPAATWAVTALIITMVSGTRPELTALALAVVGVIALAGAVRPGRWWLAVVGGLLMFCALWTVLAAWKVSVPEAYTVPPAIAFLVIGWEWTRRAPVAPSSRLSYAGGLMLLMVPTVWLTLLEQDLGWRMPVSLIVGVAIVVWGLRSRLQAPLILGGAALLVLSLRAFGPPLWDLTLLLPNWAPFAVVGLLLLFVGARYEAGLARLRGVGRYVGGLR